MIKLISSKRFIAETIEDLNLSSPDYLDRIYSWIEYGLGIMDMSKYYSLKSKWIEIKQHRGQLPCSYKYLHSFWDYNNSCRSSNNPYGLNYVPTSNSPLVGKDYIGYPVANRKISVDGEYIYSDVEKGKLLLIYRDIPKDEEGFPLVPDNPFVFEALLYFIIYRLALKGIEHPIIKYGDAFQQWERLYPRAANDVNWMALSEYEEFTQFWNSPYLGNMVKDLYIS